jgi:hypothetical protein
LVEAPQMKKLPASSQKSRDRNPSRNASSAVAAGLPRTLATGWRLSAAP